MVREYTGNGSTNFPPALALLAEGCSVSISLLTISLLTSYYPFQLPRALVQTRFQDWHMDGWTKQ